MGNLHSIHPEGAVSEKLETPYTSSFSEGYAIACSRRRLEHGCLFGGIIEGLCGPSSVGSSVAREFNKELMDAVHPVLQPQKTEKRQGRRVSEYVVK